MDYDKMPGWVNVMASAMVALVFGLAPRIFIILFAAGKLGLDVSFIEAFFVSLALMFME